MSLMRLFHTLKFLTFEQLWFQFYYKMRGIARRSIGIKPRYTYYKAGHPTELVDFPTKAESYKGNGEFCFLNVRHTFNGNWADSTNGALWRYNLNYMDFLLQPSMSAGDGCGWIMNFIDSIDSNAIAADPYPISLRGINWIKFVSLHKGTLDKDVLKKVDTSLYSQYRLLCGRTERHLMANHYLENGFSLIFGAVYFRDEMLWKIAKSIVEKQIDEQIMPDGAHFELSPMYHCVILERLLDCCNILATACNGRLQGADELLAFMKNKASMMLGWLDAIVLSDDSIPLLNDSANGVAASADVLRAYARRLGLHWKRGQLKESGYRHITRTSYEAIVDVAQLGVSYNLGHSHADTLTYLLWVNGNKFIVDTGTSTYEAGPTREYERSTKAHNTVVVNERNSSNVWGSFRCAERARVTVLEEGDGFIRAMHDGYSALGVNCIRSFRFLDNRLVVVDELQGNCDTATSYIHLAPGTKVLEVKGNEVVTDKAVLSFEGCTSLSIEKKYIAEEYNTMTDSVYIRVDFISCLETVIHDFK